MVPSAQQQQQQLYQGSLDLNSTRSGRPSQSQSQNQSSPLLHLNHSDLMETWIIRTRFFSLVRSSKCSTTKVDTSNIPKLVLLHGACIYVPPQALFIAAQSRRVTATNTLTRYGFLRSRLESRCLRRRLLLKSRRPQELCVG